jgi:hypothetical protein
MDFKIISATEGVAFIERNKDRYLAIDTGLKPKSFIGVDTSKLQSLPGLIIHNNETTNWKLQGVAEIEGTMFFYGPYLEGSSFSELDLTPEILLDLTTALDCLKDRKFPVHQFSLNSLFRTIDGKILLFPPLLIDFLNNNRKRQVNMNMLFPWNHPKLGGNQSKAFTIAALAYKSITGDLPFPGKDEEEIEKLMNKENYRSPLCCEPLLKNEISSLIIDSFAGKGDISRWKKVLLLWIKEGMHNTSLSQIEESRICEIEKRRESKRIKNNKISNNFQKNKGKLLVGIISLTFLLILIQAPLSKYLEPPVTLEMSREEVIKLYYSCFQSLNTEIMDDCITKKAGKNDINEISTIYVTTKVRSSYEGSTGMIDPSEWKQQGMKPVDPGVQVWGISELSITQISTDLFEVTYEKWNPAIVSDFDDNSPKLPVGYNIIDTIHLSVIDKAWKIDQLERVISDIAY